MEKEQKEDTTKEIIEGLQKQHSNKLRFLIIIFSVIGIIIFFILLISAYFYFKTPEKTLGIGANIGSSLLSADGKISYLKLVGGSLDKNITKIKFIFTDKEGNEHVYETSEGVKEIEVPFKRSFWDWLFRKPTFSGKYDYKINSEDTGLNDFSDINEVSVVFEYKTETGETIETPVLDTGKTTTKTTTTGGGGGGGGTSDGGTTPTPCSPNKDCSYYYNLNQCGSSLSDGCANSLNCLSCTNGTCINNSCVALPSCTTDSDCGNLTGACGTGKCNLTSESCYVNYLAGNICRNNISECDEAEVCIQELVNCPDDENKSDGNSCNGGACQKGECIKETYFDGWRVLPIRSEAEFNLGMIGGEAEQHPHSIARSLYNPEVIYWSHDIAGPWKSDDSGNTWKKTLGINLSITMGQSIEVDPINPNIVFTIVNVTYNWIINPNVSGLYRSVDGGDVLEQVLKESDSANNFNRKNIAYDLSSVDDEKANRWYAAFPDRGLYKSEDAGDTWSNIVNLTGHNPIYQIVVHPNNKKVYIASNKGLFYVDYGENDLNPLGNLPSGAVSSIQINPENPEVIYVTLYGKGLYNSLDRGETFSLLKEFYAQGVFTNPGYPDTLYLVGITSNNNNNTIITHDAGNTWITDMRTVLSSGKIGTGWKGGISGGLSGIVPNPQDENEAVAYSRATIWKTTDGGHYFNDSSTLFTGFAATWWQDSIEFDEYNPDRIMTLNCDVGPTITNNSWDYFEKRNNGTWYWYNNGLISWTGAYAGDFEPVPDSKKIVASVGYYFRTQLMYSEDEGKSWELVTSSDSNLDKHVFISYNNKNPDIVYAGDKISHNGGKNFSHVNFSGPDGDYNSENPYIAGMCLANPDIVYALDENCYMIFRSDDKGETWRIYADKETGVRHIRLDPLPTFAVDPIDCDKVYGLKNYDLAVYNGTGWRKTGVLGLVGKSSTSDLGNYIRTVAIDPNNNSIIYAGMSAAGISNIWRSLDGGYAWKDISYNRPRVGGSMRVNPHTGELLMGSGIGTWVFPSPDMKNNYLYDKGISRPSCKDGLKSGDEEGIDCGGSCLLDCEQETSVPSISFIREIINFFKRLFLITSNSFELFELFIN